MTTTITHDPDDPRGCIACPLFRGVPRDGGCRALDGPGGMNTLHTRGGAFEPDARCPLRHGGVHVRAPEPAADHHEPAEGDAVRVEPAETVLRREAEGWRSIADRASRDFAEHRSALGSIATALGMSPDALPGAIVERVEMMSVSIRAAAMHEAAERIGEVLDGAERPERAREPTVLIPALDRVETVARRLRYATGAGTFAQAFDSLRAEALDGEGVVDTVRRLIDRSDDEGDALIEAIRRLTPEMRVGETNADCIARLIRERDSARADAEVDELTPVSRTLGLHSTASTETVVAHVKDLLGSLAEARASIAELEHGIDRGNERDLRRILDSVRALLGMRDDADESNADDEIPGHLSTALAWTAQLETINDQLRAYLARAIRGCDRREQRAIEADLASDGYDAAGRPLASEEGA